MNQPNQLTEPTAPPTQPGGHSQGFVVRILRTMIAGYQRFLSPLLGPRCRFAPSCSHYAAQALATHGAWRGSALAARRVLRCHPFHPGGHDPVPPRRSPADNLRAAATDPMTVTPTARPRAGAPS